MSRETDILKAVLAEINKREVKPPEGFYRFNDWGKKWKASRRGTRAFMAVAIKKGLLVKRFFRMKVTKKICLVPFYGPPPKTKNR
jgi:hypothetical protein